MEQFEAYFQRADTDRDGRISGIEAVAFFQGFNLPKQVLAQIWTYADQNRTGFLGRTEFFNALKLVTVAQTKRDLTPELVKVVLYGPASTKIPAPQINLASAVSSNLTAGTSPAQFSGMPTSSQSFGVRGPQGFSSQPSQVMRPPRPPAVSSQLVTPRPGFSGGGSMAIPHSSNQSDSPIGTTDRNQLITPSVSNGSLTTSATPDKTKLVPTASIVSQSKASAVSGLVQSPSFKANESALGSLVGKGESKSLSASGNGFNSSKDFGDAFSTVPYHPQNNSSALSYSASSMSATSSSLSISYSRNQPTYQLSSVSQSPSPEAQQFHTTQKMDHRNLAPNSAGAGGVTSVQSQSPWLKITRLDVQKYNKVFLQVDTDRDGKITGEQARTLFLSWGLPREVLKQVWDLSDQDNDSMLSLREFCVALYLMERYREGRPLPTVLPNTIISDEILLPASGQAAAAYVNMPFRPTPGFQQSQGTKSVPQVTSTGGGKPPRPIPVPQPDEPMQQKPKVPDLEKHLVDQLSTEEQDSLNKKFEDAKDAEKKVADLEKDSLEARQKIQFYLGKMQELVLHKSRYDSRLNEIMEKVVADKREAESLAKKYEEKYRQTGDVASKLTIEEATFRDIQEKKMELYRAIAKLDQENAESIHDRANRIQSDLEELVKVLNERCKTYGVRGKPTSLVELPFGWQPGIQGTAADWDEVWDKLEDEGFTYVKELTLEVENVTAPPKPKTPLIREKVVPLDNGDSVRSPSGRSSLDRLPDNEKANNDNLEQTTRTPPDSPAGSNSFDSPKKYQGKLSYDININGSPHAFDSQSEYGKGESISGDKGFDEPGWGAYDIHYDSDAAWDFNPSTPRDADHGRRESSLFGSDDWVLNPIKTESTASDSSLKQGPFFDSVPSSPLYNSVPSTPLYNSASSPHADSSMFTRSLFADSVPSTPMYNYITSPKGYNEGFEEPYSFDSFSKTESFNMSDVGPFGSRESFSRFDSMRSTRDSNYDQGYFARHESSLARFDSFRSTADSDYNFGSRPPPNSFSRFDSSRTSDFDHRHSFTSFDETSDPFGSGEPFRTSLSAETPRKDSDGWKAF